MMYAKVIISLIYLVVTITIIVVVISYFSKETKFLNSGLTGDPLTAVSLFSFISSIELVDEEPDAKKKKKKNENKTGSEVDKSKNTKKNAADKKTMSKRKEVKKTTKKRNPSKKHPMASGKRKTGTRPSRHRTVKPGAKPSRSAFNTRFRTMRSRPPKIPRAPKPTLKRVSLFKRVLKFLLMRKL